MVPNDAAVELNLAAMGVPEGQLSVELDVPTGVQNASALIASAYNYGPGGAADAENASAGAHT